MVCKEDVVTWFQRLNAHKRIDVMCSLLDMCLPLELRFLGTCLEDLGKRDFIELRATESKSNDLSELSDLQCLSDKRTQSKLVVFLSLLRSCNYACSNGLYKILSTFDFGDIHSIINHNPADESPLDELLLLYTLAINHPGFTYEQRTSLEDILLRLQKEEHKLLSTKTRPSTNMGLLYLNSPVQPCISIPLPEDHPQLDVGMSSLRSRPTPLAMTPTTIPIVPDPNKNRCSLPPGLSIPPGLGLPPEQLPPSSYIPVAYPSPSHQPISSVSWQGSMSPMMLPALCGEVQGSGETSPFPSSPLRSRPASPTRSGSPSQTGSPQPVEQCQGFLKGTCRSERNLPLSSSSRQNSIDTTMAPPVQVRNATQNINTGTEPVDTLQETLGKEMPNYLPNLQNYSVEELKGMSEEELTDLGLPSGAINQLRSIVTKLQNTNGICIQDKREPPSSTARRKRDFPEIEVCEQRPQSTPYVRSFSAVPMDGTRLLFPAPPANPCYSYIVPTRYQSQPPQLYGVNHNLHHLHLDSNSSSGSNSSSASQSPPETPSAIAAPNWERGFSIAKEQSGEVWSPSCDEREEKERLPETMVPQQPLPSSGNNTRPRLPGALGRSKVNPPGVQTNARGRGPKPNTVILEGNQKTLPSCRRDGTIINGALPRNSHPPLSLPSTSQPPPTQYPGNQSNPSSRSGDGGNVPYNPAAPYLSHTQFHPLRAYTNYVPSNYIRPAFPFPNGEIVYQYHGPQTPPPPPPTAFMPTPVPNYTAVFTPQMCCYNCGQGHHASECKEPTMEEVAKPGQYRLDYTPHQRPGECLSEK